MCYDVGAVRHLLRPGSTSGGPSFCASTRWGAATCAASRATPSRSLTLHDGSVQPPVVLLLITVPCHRLLIEQTPHSNRHARDGGGSPRDVRSLGPTVVSASIVSRFGLR